MNHLPKIFLAAAVVSLLIGVSDLRENSLFYMGRPLAAIFFILFMMFQFFQKEIAAYDKEEKARKTALQNRNRTAAPAPKEPTGRQRQVPAHSAA
jgi:hypothetical protein